MEGTSFASWDSFSSELAAYCARTHQPLAIASSTPRAKRNATIAKRVIKRYGDMPELVKRELQGQLIPETFGFYAKTITCTHAGEPRQRASTARPHQFHRVIGCKARINVCVQYNTAKKQWLLNVTGQELQHNHAVAKEIWRVLVDTTHNVNSAHYKLFSFMVHDAFGNGQYVQHGLIEDEKGSTLRTVCAQFKKTNSAWEKIRAIIMDKDITEMTVIEREFPNARVLLCQIQFIRGILRDNDKIQRWFEYFDANGTSIKEKWCSVYRCDLPHLGNNTNNRLESSWGKLKDLVNKFNGVDECLVSILFWQRTKELAWRRRITRVGRESVAGADAQIKALAPIVSRYTLKLIRDQYEFAIANTTEYNTYSLAAITCIQYKPHVEESHDEEWSEPTDLDVPDEFSVSLKDSRKENVDSDSITTLMDVIQRTSVRRVLVLPIHATTIPFLHQDLLRTAPAIESLQYLGSLAGNASLPVIIAAIHFDDPEHWCGLVFDIATNTFTSFDPLQSVDRYSTIEWWVGKHLNPCIPRFHQAVPQSKRFTSLQQQDTYNCGVLVLLFFEIVLKGIATAYFAPDKLKHTLQYARYRYLCMGLGEVSATASDTDQSDFESEN
ncbi:hypothetical protein P43SY_012097 [Pythium insidiosum]|uniref:Ubiquitin-like protease family profile domain-containing protein n=1 Tax=Pythium insidiosum TaxID=114742 RepID=A0AAD5Q1W3_PYTIN|nr:hypothetical protein P43SY_012097 [Pythium insidiosum]